MILIILLTVTVILGGYISLALFVLKKKQKSPEAYRRHDVPLCSGAVLEAPESWEVRRTPHQIILQSGKKDGVLTIQKVPWSVHQKSMRSLMLPYLVRWDPQFTEEPLAPHIESIENYGTDPYTDERVYFQLFRIRLGQEVILSTYKSSVLFAMVDGYQIRDIMLSLKSESNDLLRMSAASKVIPAR